MQGLCQNDKMSRKAQLGTEQALNYGEVPAAAFAQAARSARTESAPAHLAGAPSPPGGHATRIQRPVNRHRHIN